MNALDLDWSDLRIFLALARAGTLSEAARTLKVDGSTTQRRIGGLERDLGVRLFDRTTRGFALTPAGQELLAHAEALEGEVQTALRRLRGRDLELRGVIRVETALDGAVHVLPSLLASFRKAHPGVWFEITTANEVRSLAQAPAHVALRFGPPPSEATVIAKRAGDERSMLYARQGLVTGARRPTAPTALASLDTIRVLPGLGPPETEQYFLAHANPDRIAVRAGSFSEISSLLLVHDAVGFLPCIVGDAVPGLARVPGSPHFDGAVWVVYHVDMRGNARVRAFVEHACEHLARLAPQLIGELPERSQAKALSARSKRRKRT